MNIKLLVPTLLLAFFSALFVGTGWTANSSKLTKQPAIKASFDHEGTQLKLNGHSIRKTAVKQISIYRASLYLSEKNDSAKSILGLETPKVLLLEFLVNQSSNNLIDSFSQGLEKNVDKKTFRSYRKIIAKIKKALPDAKPGDTFKCVFLSNLLELTFPGDEVIRITDSQFSNDFLKIWIGKNPPSKKLKNELLGLKTRKNSKDKNSEQTVKSVN